MSMKDLLDLHRSSGWCHDDPGAVSVMMISIRMNRRMNLSFFCDSASTRMDLEFNPESLEHDGPVSDEPDEGRALHADTGREACAAIFSHRSVRVVESDDGHGVVVATAT